MYVCMKKQEACRKEGIGSTYSSFGVVIVDNLDGYGVNGGRASKKSCKARVVMLAERSAEFQALELVERG